MISVLFVDDNVNNLHAMREEFGTCHDEWDTAFVPGAEVALFVMSERPVDAVVASSALGDMSAANFLRVTKDKHPRTARIAMASPGDRGASLRALPVANLCLRQDCPPDELARVVGRVAELQRKLHGDATRHLVEAVGTLPSLPTTLVAVDNALCDEECSPSAVADVMSGDVAMVAKVLQLVNSPFFGLRTEIKDLRQAVAYLGIEALRDIALAGAAFHAFTPGQGVPARWLPALNAHSMSVAGALGPLVRPQARAEANVVGTLHAVGELVVADRAPAKLAEVAADVMAGASPDEAEERHLGTTYPVIGGYLLSSWGMGYNVVEAVTRQRELYIGPPKAPELADCLRVVEDLLARHEPRADVVPPVCQAGCVCPLDDGYAAGVGLSEAARLYEDGFSAMR